MASNSTPKAYHLHGNGGVVSADSIDGVRVQQHGVGAAVVYMVELRSHGEFHPYGSYKAKGDADKVKTEMETTLFGKDSGVAYAPADPTIVVVQPAYGTTTVQNKDMPAEGVPMAAGDNWIFPDPKTIGFVEQPTPEEGAAMAKNPLDSGDRVTSGTADVSRAITSGDIGAPVESNPAGNRPNDLTPEATANRASASPEGSDHVENAPVTPGKTEAVNTSTTVGK